MASRFFWKIHQPFPKLLRIVLPCALRNTGQPVVEELFHYLTNQKSKALLSEMSLLEHTIVVLMEDACSTQYVSWTLSLSYCRQC